MWGTHTSKEETDHALPTREKSLKALDPTTAKRHMAGETYVIVSSNRGGRGGPSWGRGRTIQRNTSRETAQEPEFFRLLSKDVVGYTSKQEEKSLNLSTRGNA